MSTEQYYGEAKGVLLKFETLLKNWKDGYTNYEDSDSVIREFQHLVYTFDKDLPLNKELNDINKLFIRKDMGTDGFDVSKANQILEYMRFFIKYIEKYDISSQIADNIVI